ncbi:MAG: hypothetical protein HZA90_10095 [Verrucomicrobia bacterium]|nr:hypothetical protein [Verrucomicrobiota bacterium]
MKANRHLLLSAALGAGVLLAAGCRKSQDSDKPKDAPVSGKPSDPPAELKAEWKPGYRFVMHMEMNQNSQWQFGPRPTTQDTSMSTDYALSVTNAPDGHRGMELEIQSLALDVSFGENTIIRYDSLNKVAPSEGPGVDALDKLIGGRIRYLVAPNNEIVQVDGVKELVDRVEGTGGGAGAGGPGGGRRGARGLGMMGGALRGIYNAEYFKQLVDLSGLPKEAVRVGDHWTMDKEISAAAVGTILLRTTNTLAGWQEREGRKCARIEFTGTMSTKPGAAGATGPAAAPWGGGMKLEDGKVNGTSWFAPEIGMVIESASEQSYNVSGTRPAMGGRRGTNAPPQATNAPPEKFTSPVKQTVSVKLVEVSSLDQPSKSAAAPEGQAEKK